MQRNWIGRSDGRPGRLPRRRRRRRAIEVFTTRPDTLFGATYMVLAPEHELVDALVPAAWPEGTARRVDRRRTRRPAEAVAAYRAQAARKTDVERQAEAKDKTGVFTGAYATNPVNGAPDPGLHRRLRADGLRHRRDHGGARPGRARLGVRRGLRPADHPHRRSRRDGPSTGRARSPATAPAINSANDEISLDGLGVADAKAAHHRLAGAHGHRRGHRHLPAARLAVQPPALLGRAVPDRLRRGRRRRSRCPSRCCRWSCPRSTTTRRDLRPGRRRHPSPRPPLSPRRGLGQRRAGPGRRPEARTAARPTPCPTGPVRAGTSCATWTRPTPSASSTRRSSSTGWARARRRTPAASTCTSAASSTPCCTCCTPASGTRCCSTWATSPSFEPFHKLFNQGNIQAYAYTRRPRRLRAGRRGRGARTARYYYGRASRSTASTARWASR